MRWRGVFWSFQSSFMRISFCELAILVGIGFMVGTMQLFFQSSFMRISFCEAFSILISSCAAACRKPFNPLLWGFLFARRRDWGKREEPGRIRLSILFYEDFFLRATSSWCACSTRPISLSILFYEDFFLRGGNSQSLSLTFNPLSTFQSSFMRISFCESTI